MLTLCVLLLCVRSDRVWDVSSLLSLSYTLHDVAADGNLRALRKMLETTEANCVDARDAEGLTPLHLATMCADYAAVCRPVARGKAG